jgi:hypothetical protein
MTEQIDTARIADTLSDERLAPYLRACDGDLGSALNLYQWNLAISGALYEALGILEVAVRNALCHQLNTFHASRTGYWYDDPGNVLSGQARDDLAEARNRVAAMGRTETPGRVIAELSFGFWRYLLASRYEATLWTPYLRHAFPNLAPQRRVTAYRAMASVHLLRNRISHHEPIHKRDLAADMVTIYRLLDWIDHDLRTWAVAMSRVQTVLANRPPITR